MTEFLNAVKADLLDRRMLPLLVLVGVALAAALGYAVLGGGSSGSAPVTATSRPIHVTGITVSPAPPNPNEAAAETTNGAPVQRRGLAHDPFSPLPAQKLASAAATSNKTSSSSTTTSATTGTTKTSAKSEPGSSAPSGGPSTPATPSKPSAPSKPKTVYLVAVLFGALAPGTSPLNALLRPYQNLKLLTPLPSAKQPLVIFRGVTAAGKSAAFTLVGEVIIHGNATCLPSTTQCALILLKPGQGEQLEYLPPAGQPVTYELRVASIAQAKASSASLKRSSASESKVGRALLGAAGLRALGGMRYSETAGVLVFPRRRAAAARSRDAVRGLHG